ncbi:hypothetical protein PSPO01_07309 [Paraphaeosphaeria sporulosa]
MASRAIPSHLKPSAAAGNGDSEGGQRHHGKTASHFVRIPIVLGPAVLRSLYHQSIPNSWPSTSSGSGSRWCQNSSEGSCFVSGTARGGDDTVAKRAPHHSRPYPRLRFFLDL